VVPQLAQRALDVLENRGGDAAEDGAEAHKSASQSLFESVQATQARASLSCFHLSDKFWPLHERLRRFMEEHVYPNEATYFTQHEALRRANNGSPWHVPPIMEELKSRAKEAGLWNLFFTNNKVHGHSLGLGLTNVEYAPLCELMGRAVHMAPEIFSQLYSGTARVSVAVNADDSHVTSILAHLVLFAFCVMLLRYAFRCPASIWNHSESVTAFS
jgi:hypothetical protein